MGLRTEALWVALPCSLSPIKTHYAFKRQRWLSKKRSVCCCITSSRIDRWYNPNSQRKFEQLEIERQWVESDSLPQLHSEDRFTIVSYNILGDRNASKHGDLYLNVPHHYMKWDRRKQLICEELIGLQPDIICLQEVDKYYDLSLIMKKEGYISTYKRRTGGCVDGCAMFWKANKFHLLEEESIEFKKFGLRDNVAQICVFEMQNADSRRALVGNIHVSYNPRRGEIKLGQIRLLLSKAHSLSEKWGNVPLVLVGDFNSTPQSAVYKFLSSSKLDIKLYDKRDLSGQRSCRLGQSGGIEEQFKRPYLLTDRFLQYCWTDEEVKIATGNPNSTIVYHPLSLISSYASLKGSVSTRDSCGEPLATTFHSKFLGTVDYLWHSEGLVPTRVLDTLPIDVLRKTCGLPHEKFGSDQLALVSEFTFTQCSTKDECTPTNRTA